MRAVYDFLALLLAALAGVASSYVAPPEASVGAFLAAYGVWLAATGPIVPSARSFGLPRGVARASLGGILIAAAAVLYLRSAGAEARLILLVVLSMAAVLVLYLHALAEALSPRR